MEARGSSLLSRALSELSMTLPSAPLFWGITGSRMYGLNSEGSDYDLMVIVQDKLHKDISRVSDVYDVKIVPFSAFVERYMDSSANEVDLVASRNLHFLNGSYAPIVSALRFDHLEYGFRQEAHALRWIREIRGARDNPHRDDKRTRTILRNLSLTLRLRESDEAGRVFDVRFSARQRELFFNLVPTALDSLRNAVNEDEAFSQAMDLAKILEGEERC